MFTGRGDVDTALRGAEGGCDVDPANPTNMWTRRYDADARRRLLRSVVARDVAFVVGHERLLSVAARRARLVAHCARLLARRAPRAGAWPDPPRSASCRLSRAPAASHATLPVGMGFCRPLCATVLVTRARVARRARLPSVAGFCGRTDRLCVVRVCRPRRALLLPASRRNVRG